MVTHYIPFNTQTNGRKRLALCGAWVLSEEHSQEPTCPVCESEQRAEERREQEGYAAMGFALVDGVLREVQS